MRRVECHPQQVLRIRQNKRAKGFSKTSVRSASRFRLVHSGIIRADFSRKRNIPQKTEEDQKDSKKNTKKDFKKEEKKKEAKESKDNKDNKDNKEEPKEIELVLEPVKIDGYCFRTIKEDQSLEDNEKAGGKDKKGAKKK